MQSGSEMSGVVGSGLEFSGEADGAGFIGAKEIQAKASQKGEVLGSIAQTNQACIFAKGHIETPVQSVLDTPMGSDRMQNATTVSGKRTDDVAFLGRNLSAHLACRLNAGDRCELRPACLQAEEFEPVELTDSGAASGFDSAMPPRQSLTQMS